MAWNVHLKNIRGLRIYSYAYLELRTTLRYGSARYCMYIYIYRKIGSFTRQVSSLVAITSPLCVQSRETLNVSQFHITNWAPDGSCSNIKTVTDVIDEIIKVQIRTGNKPITVHCRFILVLLTVVLTDRVCMCVQ